MGSSSQSEQGGVKGKAPKANWNAANRKLYIELAHEEILKGNGCGTGFTKTGWENIIKEFNRRTKKKYKKKQFKNHHNRLKDEWKIWDKLIKTPGLVYNPNTHSITTNDEQIWEDFIKAYPMAAGFRDKALEHCEMLKAIFPGTLEIGDLMQARSARRLMDRSISSRRIPKKNLPVVNNEQGNFHVTLVDPNTHMRHESDDTGSPSVGESEHYPHAKRRAEHSISSRRPRKECKCATIDSYMSTISRYFEFKMTHTPSPSKEEGDKYSIPECLKRLKELPGIERGSDLKFFSVELLQSESRRKTFIELVDDPEECVLWLKTLMGGRFQQSVV